LATEAPLTWTDKQREVAELIGQGKTFAEIHALGYSKRMINRVSTALKGGQQPTSIEAEAVETETIVGTANAKTDKGKGDAKGDAKDKPLVSIAGSKGSPIVFWVEQKKIIIDPFELHNQYRYYLDLARKNGGISETFSEVLTLGMQVLWVLHQDIPMTENMLKAVFSK
jgi:hypothetical protein